MSDWIDYAGGSRQPFTPSLGWKREPSIIVLHSTEGGGYPSAATYGNGTKAPHFTLNPFEHTFRQHYPLSRAAFALVAPADGTHTNTGGAVQIEIVGTCVPGNPVLPSVLTLDEDALAYIAGFLGALSAATGIPLSTGVEFKPYPASYGPNGVRLDRGAWETYRGVLGHQHVPGNVHGDPGTLNVARILELAGGAVLASNPVRPPTPQGDPVLHVGSSGTAVRTVQAYLGGLEVDGVFGPVTKAAVVAYQTGLGLAPDGIVGAQTWAAIKAGLRPVAAAPVIRHGEQLDGDGIFGAQTKAALQRALGVEPDGVIGPVTTRALQARVGATADGVWGLLTTKALQSYLGVTVDGVAGVQTYSALQARLNAGTF